MDRRSPIPLNLERVGSKQHTVSLPIPVPVGTRESRRGAPRGHRRSRSDLAFGYALENSRGNSFVISRLSPSPTPPTSYLHTFARPPRPSSLGKEEGISALKLFRSSWRSKDEDNGETKSGRGLDPEVEDESDLNFELGSEDLNSWRFAGRRSEDVAMERATSRLQIHRQEHDIAISIRSRTPQDLPRLILPDDEGMDYNHPMSDLVQTPSPAYSSPSRDGLYPPPRYSPPHQQPSHRYEGVSSPTSPTQIPLLSLSLSSRHRQRPASSNSTPVPSFFNPFRSFSFLRNTNSSSSVSPSIPPRPTIPSPSPPLPSPALSTSPSDSPSAPTDILQTPVLPSVSLPLDIPLEPGITPDRHTRRTSRVSFVSTISGGRGGGEREYWQAI
ncbi:hypothetical protein NLI96_g1707 [Meripilus lineatus]|uniref:Uncharacterized protein n=1 Tax=Meripilus lineatus TaxID=2056292 RepID=A0AAD5YMK6_9APHY|nr:hypothetical protein NLI96_g1707 [Physisporinus lineatus]